MNYLIHELDKRYQLILYKLILEQDNSGLYFITKSQKTEVELAIVKDIAEQPKGYIDYFFDLICNKTEFSKKN